MDIDNGFLIAKVEHAGVNAWAEDINIDGACEILYSGFEGDLIFNGKLEKIGMLSQRLKGIPRGSFKVNGWAFIATEENGVARIFKVKDVGPPGVTLNVNATQVRESVEV